MGNVGGLLMNLDHQDHVTVLVQILQRGDVRGQLVAQNQSQRLHG